MKKIYYLCKLTCLILLTLLLSNLFTFTTAIHAIELFDFENFSEEDSVYFVEYCDIEFPEEFLELEDFDHFTHSLVLHAYYHPNESFHFNNPATQIYAEQIRSAVLSIANLASIPASVCFSSYSLQYNKVMDENGNWVTSGGYYDPSWYNYNCYAYSINRAEQPQFYSSNGYIQYQPGDMSKSGNFLSTTTIDELALIVQNDLIAMGYSDVSLSSTVPGINSSEELICVRRYSGYDYHFMKYDIETNSWYHKPGRTSVLKYNNVPTNDLPWYAEYSYTSGEGVYDWAYDSDIVFIKYSKNILNALSGEEVRINIQPGKDVFLEFAVQNEAHCLLDINAIYPIEFEVYNEHFDLILSKQGNNSIECFDLEEGKYYIRANFESQEVGSYIDVSITCNCTDITLSTHTINCSNCGYIITEAHNYEYEINNSETHLCRCVDCGCCKTMYHVADPSYIDPTGRYDKCRYCEALYRRTTITPIIKNKIIIDEESA